jgi:hypothetical protein
LDDKNKARWVLLNILAKKLISERFKTLKNSRNGKKIPALFFCPLVPPSWIVQNVTPRELSRRSIPPISMVMPYVYYQASETFSK